MKHLLVPAVFLLLVMAAGCSESGSNAPDEYFVDIDSLISSRIEKMAGEERSLEKIVTYEDTTITTTVGNPDLKKELQPFRNVIIPRVSWNSYARRIDTVGDKVIFLYQASDSALDLNRFAMHRKMNGEVTAMHFNFRTSNLFSQSDQLLIWEENENNDLIYRIEGEQHTRFFGKEIYRIQGKLTKITANNL